MRKFVTVFRLRAGLPNPRYLSAAVMVVLVGLGVVGPGVEHGFGQTSDQTAADLKDPVESAVDTRQQTQAALDDWSAERAELIQRFRTARANVQWLQERKQVETARVTAVEERVAELRRRLDEGQRLESSLQDTLTVILKRLDASTARGLPFLSEERSLRLASLHEELIQPDVAAAEKLRRVLEALQVEAGYGSTVEVYQDKITLSGGAGEGAGNEAGGGIAGETLHADILRLGRLALFWRTPDAERVGHYDPAGAGWVELDGSYRRPIGLAMEMASRIRPIELIELPLGRIAP